MAAVNIFRESAIAVLIKPKTIPLEGILLAGVQNIFSSPAS
jgi:hypothetical protein